MDKAPQQKKPVDSQLSQLKEDYDMEWWRAYEVDEFNIKNKLLRVGCRPLKRKYLACQKSNDGDPQYFAQCRRLRNELDECYKALHFLQIQMAQEKIENQSNIDLINRTQKNDYQASYLQDTDNSNLKDFKHSPRDVLNFDYPQYKRFDLTDIYIILGVFLVGFIFALVLSNYYKIKKEKIEQINQKFQGLKGEYEKVEKNLKRYTKWRYQIKFIEKVYYVFLLSLGVLFYKSPPLFHYILQENAAISIPLFSFLFLFFHFLSAYLDKQELSQEKRHLKLKDKLKDTKRLLISHMDPIMVQAVKEIVKNDMKQEIELMRASDQGCSKKCSLTNDMLKKDLGRNKVVVNELINFKWCDTCQNVKQPGAVSVCQAGCGQKIYGRCLPLMKEYGEMEKEIQQLKSQVKELGIQSQKFSEYQKAKKELEYEEKNRKAMTYSQIDKTFFKAQKSSRLPNES